MDLFHLKLLIGLWIYFIHQVDRQQVRIRGLIEEQDSKIDEERSLVERRAQEQLRQVREEAESQAGVNLQGKQLTHLFILNSLFTVDPHQ